MRKQPSSWPVLLSELVDQGYGATAGQLLDRLYAEGAQVGMNPRGLAVRQETADRLRAEREEAERIAQEEAEKAEIERLQRLEERQKRQEVEQEGRGSGCSGPGAYGSVGESYRRDDVAVGECSQKVAYSRT